jgi:hypothetical protein
MKNKASTSEREYYLDQLNTTVYELTGMYRNLPDPELPIDEAWTAKDILGHITFWHESFARNVRDLSNDVKPTPLKGKLGDLNQRGVDEMRDCTIQEVMRRLEEAHKVIQDNILNARLILIPYRRGSREYTPEEHLEITNDHIRGHLQKIERAIDRRFDPGDGRGIPDRNTS